MVSIIACSMRPSYMKNVFANFERQTYKNKEMIIVLNRDDMDKEKWEKKASKFENVRVYQVPERYRLGRCLNYGIRRAKYDIIAKFDDDDYYGPDYLKEVARPLLQGKASVVGKNASYIYFAGRRALMLYRRGGEHQYRRNVKGGTLTFKKRVWRKVKFNEKKRHGSDVAFLRGCRKRGYKIYSVSRYNYVCIRRRNTRSHTQKTGTRKYMARCRFIRRTKRYVPLVTKRIK
ncbi:glycosyltransferase family A protein [Paenibacillus xerothermodurans]|uniref:Glycosyltransferase family 2 protein n=1 Tax=Paenibacillus xerothermodurans TaxID=1977292 RepID=A0A2W1NV57_PAEXE|nr:glycosyltransferase family A protein [Paenibacillus xerothermodurans]PZE21646.1 glycosyltransferase family 2 protein [Paenibacillus xerothermodurans]